MDLALCSLNRKTMTLECAGAYNPVWLLRGDDIIEIKGNKFPIGSFMDDAVQNFDNNMVSLKKGDQIYIFTDGYSDQFGGPKGKKFKEKNLKSLLLAVKNLSMDQQKEHLNEKIEEWRGDLEQIDDILIMGVRI
jgi:serine phosphatase RsbU (regulator of sigma subunit)